jgi:hypothetical protein
MKARSHSMPEACPATSPSVHIVQVEVSCTHPLLLLKQALPWEAITEAMTRHWRQRGKFLRPRSGDRPLYAFRGGLRGAGASSTVSKIAANIERGF